MSEDLSNAPVDDAAADVAAAISELRGETPPPVAEQAAQETPAEARARNERGQFTKAETVEAATPPAAKPVPDADPSSANTDAPSTAVEAPKGWSAEAKAEFGKLSPAVQAAVVKRESEINDGGARWSEEKRTLTEAITPLRGLAAENKVPEAEVAKRLVSAERFIRNDPKAAIEWIANRSGLKVSIDGAQAKPPQPQADPVVAQLQSEVSSLKNAHLAGEIQAFAAKPGREHFAAVRTEMGKLMLAAANMGEELSLDQAYEQAIWLKPEIRAQLTAAPTADAARAKAAKDKETADRARRGAISANGSPGSGAPTPRPEYATVEDATRAAWAAHRH